MNRINDKWYRIIGIPLVALVSNIIFYYDMNDKHGFKFLQDYGYTLATTALIWELNRQVILYTRTRFSSLRDSAKRIAWTAAGVVLLTTALMVSISAFYDLNRWWGYAYTFKNYLYNVFAALTYIIIIGGVYEGSYYFRRWRNVELESALLKKANLQSQFDSLKAQVSPHFLFNSLNTLSSLIRKDVDRAELFLDELSKVYRYLLRNNEDILIELDAELRFIASYFHLLVTRYGGAVQLKISVSDSDRQLLLPPLTLQLLLENAVKHNTIEKSAPLMISIHAAGNGSLTMSNNLQPKIIKPVSEHIGLKNIAAKYRLLGQPEPAIDNTHGSFSVCIPLLKNNVHEDINSRR